MREQVLKLQRRMRELGIDVYVVSDIDEHLSEYVSEHFHALEEYSGFTGGDGKLVVTAGKEDAGNADASEGSGAGKAALWTDGRYFTQAENQLAGSGIELMRMGEPETPLMNDWILENLPEGGTLGFDGKCTPFREGKALADKVHTKGVSCVYERDLCGELWETRPAQKVTPCWILDEKYTGKSAADKIADMKSAMDKAGADAHILTTVDDIAWLLNLRADDVPNNPVFMSYLMITPDGETRLYTEAGHITDEVAEYLKDLGVHVFPYHQIYEDVKELKGDIAVLLDKKRCNYTIVSSIPAEVRIIGRINPEAEAKACKNEVERANIRIAQHKDSVALTKFMHWFMTEGLELAQQAEEQAKAAGISVKELYANAADAEEDGEKLTRFTEWTVAEKLHSFRAAQPGFFDESFGTISAYGANAAMAHYAPTSDPALDTPIEPRGLYLVDSGGQYPEGTTDVTRTWSCGPITTEERTGYTLTVMANLRLGDAKFLEGTSGLVLDYAAREPFWRLGMNYNHGTGHGVGHVLNVHEAPVGIRYRAADMEGAWPLLEGMYLSDEPGSYVAGRYGVRIENLVLVVPYCINEYGRFMKFETVNFCPVDRACLDVSLMDERDIHLLNLYHKKVYEELADDMTPEEREWLEAMCAPIVRNA